jgi:glycosyltransferase involved in cell wall biosynthesis
VQAEADAFVDKLRQFKQLGGTIVWTIHNTVSHDTSHYDAEITFAKAIVALADRIHLHSARSVDEVETHFVIPREKLRIARHGNYLGAYADFVPRDVARRDLGLGEDDDVLLFTGALRRYKGLDSLLSAFERMLPQRPSVRLVLAGSTKAGDEPLLEGVSAAARSRILLVDRFLDNDEMQLYFRAADAGVYPYDEVLTSGSIMLAQSFGLPVVAPDFGMIVEAVGSAAGALYDRRDPAGLEAALERVLAAKSSGEIEAMRTAAVAAARRNSWQPFARTVLD